jgi:alkanesulfonate monooxygenase SsuD/methylene tetrahydromethanopterin reductase-like flavin-dependent oxidoreductase (luciferase family)
MAPTGPRRLGFFTRLLDQATAGERYCLATEQIVHAERHGFDSAWVAQHHFDGDEGGLPAPFVFLAHVAARTSRIRLGTGIVTLPLDEPVRVAEDAAVFDLISNGRLELGLGSGGTPSTFAGFGRDSADRAAIFDRHMTIVRGALAGKPLGGGNIFTQRRRISSIGSGRPPFQPPGARGWRSRRRPHAVAHPAAN